jgi:hypothetical protein
MPQCKKCNAAFPIRFFIDGKERIVNSRKYCLDCSPFNQHNTRKLETVADEKECICKVCGNPFKYIKGKTARMEQCLRCIKAQQRQRTKAKAVAYKDGKCILCGYDRHITSLTFHHLDPENKRFNISHNLNQSWETLKQELDKCVLLCRNCHGEVEIGFVSLNKVGG